MKKTIEKKTEELKKEILKEITDNLQVSVKGYFGARCALMDLRGKCLNFNCEGTRTGHLTAKAVMNMMGVDIYLLTGEYDRDGNELQEIWMTARKLEEDGTDKGWNLSVDELLRIREAVLNNKEEWRKRAFNPFNDFTAEKPSEVINARLNQSWEEYRKMTE